MDHQATSRSPTGLSKNLENVRDAADHVLRHGECVFSRGGACARARAARPDGATATRARVCRTSRPSCSRASTTAVDWWSFDVLLYEMMGFRTPFYDKNRKMMFQAIISSAINFPVFFSDDARDYLEGLLKKDPPRASLGRGRRRRDQGARVLRAARLWRALRPQGARAVQASRVRARRQVRAQDVPAGARRGLVDPAAAKPAGQAGLRVRRLHRPALQDVSARARARPRANRDRDRARGGAGRLPARAPPIDAPPVFGALI